MLKEFLTLKIIINYLIIKQIMKTNMLILKTIKNVFLLLLA